MAVGYNPRVVTDGLALALDAGSGKNSLTAVEVLVVAGGGGGGGRSGGGGGAGGLIYNSNFSVSPGTAISLTVGDGGTGGAGSGPPGSDGSNSIFGSLTAIGGGGGGSDGATGGRTGGSGGGGKYGSAGGTGTSGQGFAGGSGTSNTWKAGGGGGAGGVGLNGVGGTHKCGDGGPGLGFSISGTFTYYAGGGGGGSHNSGAGGCCDDVTARGLGGIGGGGNGGIPGGYNAGDNATANSGGGGGGGSTIGGSGGAGGNGGSGIVIVRYPGPQKAIGGTVTSVDGYTIHTFTTVGSSTFTPYGFTNNSAILGLPDLSGNGNSAIASNGPTYSNGSIVFDGVDDYVSVGNLGSFPTQGTISYWMNSSAVENYRNPFTTKYNGGNAGIRFEQYTTVSPYGGFNAVIGNDSGTYSFHDYSSTAVLTENVWYNVVLVWNTSTNNVVGYLNGVEKFNASQSLWPTTLPSVAIGNGYSSSRFFAGKISNTQIYNKALSASEIQQNFNALRGRFGI